jgi:polyisoprenoid-binding protein YceI
VGRGPGFDHAVLSEIHLGAADPRQVEGEAPFSGSLLLHGTKREVSGQASVHRNGPSVQVEARFPIRVSDFGIARPQYLGVGVRDPVTVVVSLVARPDTGEESSR